MSCPQKKIQPDAVVAKLQADCRSRGVSGVRDLGRLLCAYDCKDPGTLSFSEFSKGIRQFGLSTVWSDEELKDLFGLLDRSGAGQVLTDDLMNLVRRAMSWWRINIVDKVFAKVDQDRDGFVSLRDLEAAYDYQKHPKYLNGDWARDEVVENFIRRLAIADDNCDKDAMMSRKEFQDFYAGVGMFIERDVDFDYVVRSNWKI